MASASRAFALRSSLRAAASRQTPRLIVARPATAVSRRGYASAHGAAEKSSDLPWLIGSVASTVLGLAYLLSGSSSKPSSAHHGGSETPSGAPIPPEDEAPAIEKSDESKSDGEGGTQQFSSSEKKEGDKADNSSQGEDNKEGNQQAGHTDQSQTGQETPPPSADNASIAEKWDEKKEGHEEYKEKSRAGETKVLTSSSDAPSKKTQTEDPREDPKGGEGEGAKKGGPDE